MTKLATVLEPGVQTTVQDAGRGRARHLGVPQSGAADRLSLALANAALGNPWNAGALECALKGPTLRFDSPCAFAIAGANMKATLNDAPVSMYQRCEARAGDTLTLSASATGARAYIAFEGGVAGADFFGSVSTYLPAALGGVEGRALSAGDSIEGAELETTAPAAAPRDMRPTFAHDWIFRATRGPEFDLFNREAARAFFSAHFTADARGDRMGVRLNGPQIDAPDVPSMKSSAVFPGTVQVPADGAPFLLLADAQTVGGYPRVAQVIDADLHLGGQVRAGDRLWFTEISADQARDITSKKQAMIASFISGFRLG